MCLAILLGTLAASTLLSTLPLPVVSRFAITIVPLAIGLAIYAAPRGVWSASAIYLITLCVFHLGLVALVATNRQIPLLGQRELAWLYRPSMSSTVVIVTIGILSCVTGLLTAMLFLTPRHPETLRDRRAVPLGRRLAGTGATILALSLAGWLYTVVRGGGLALLTSSYGEFLAATHHGGLIPYVDFGIALGIALLAAAPPSRTRRLGFGAFLVFSTVALPLGLRGEVMFPALAALAVTARRKPVVSGKLALGAAVGVLTLIGVLREVREVGVGDLRAVSVAVSPAQGLAELGSTIRTVNESFTWHVSWGEPFVDGASYLAPIDRLARGLLAAPRQRGELDDRLFNVVIRERVGPIGGSPVAEAYHNAGLAGVLAALFVTGFILGRLDVAAPTVVSQAITGVLLVPLLIQVRNDFTPVPMQILLGMTVVRVLMLVNPRNTMGRMVSDAAATRRLGGHRIFATRD